jgi:cobalt-zinc-cadmium efflux system outer membrane protein
VSGRLFPCLPLAGLAVAGLAGCVHYQAKPISPPDTLAAFEARSFDDPGLRQFLQANHSVPPSAAAPWDLQPLTLVAFYYNPDLDVARAELAAAEAGTVTAGARENPAAVLSAGRNTTTPVSLISPWILGFNLDVPLTTAGKRGHRIAQATSLAEAARFNLAAVAWQVRSRVRASLVELYAATKAEELLSEQEAIQHDNAALLERQLEAGAVSSVEVTQVHLALAAARIARRDAAARRVAARVQLADAIGIPAAALEGVPLSFENVMGTEEEVPTPQARRQAVLNRADVLGALAEYVASQAALQLEIAKQYPDIHLGPGYEFDQGDNKWFLALSLPLPIVNRNRGPIGEAEARRTAAAARFVAVQAHAVGQVAEAVAAYGAARETAATAANMAGDLEKQERTARARFEAGEISRLELGGARLERVSASLARLDALIKAQSALGQLEDVMQSPLGVAGSAWQLAPRLSETSKSEEHP